MHRVSVPPEDTDALLTSVRACNLCEADLPHGARPVFQIGADARILIAGQAPGSKVHASGVSFDDASGDRLRDWMGIDKDTFYDASKVAILPMGFCYPGRGKLGDLPPLARCAETWREPLLASIDDLRLTLVIGQYALRWHLDDARTPLTEAVRAWRSHGASTLPLPHPSPRNNIWLKKNPWFETEVLPELKSRVRRALG